MEAQQAAESSAGNPSGIGTAASAGRPPRREGLLRTLTRQRLAVAGGIIVLFFAVISLIGPFIAPYEPLRQDIPNRLAPPTWEHWMGTDGFGRDILSRLLAGANISFRVGVVAVGVAGIIGLVFGLIAGFSAASSTR